MALNTCVTLYIRTITSNSDHTMTFPGLQLGTIYNQIMQYCYVHFPEDEVRNEHMSDLRQTSYMGITYVRNNIVAPHRPVLLLCKTYSMEHNSNTIYYLRADEQESNLYLEQEEEYDDESVVISIASSQTIDEQEGDPQSIPVHEMPASG